MLNARANPVLIAVDTGDLVVASGLIAGVAAHVGGIKLGLEFFTANGPAGVREVAPQGTPLLLDMKLHDIPNTVAGAVASLTRSCAPEMLTIHAQGGAAMIAAAREAAESAANGRAPRMKIIAVTVLTSLDGGDLAQMGVADPVADQVLRLARMAMAAGADGLVCSPAEVGLLRRELGEEPVLVVPGIRPAGVAAGDQKRAMTPVDAVEAGASFIVVGRAITGAGNPVAAAEAIAAEVGGR